MSTTAIAQAVIHPHYWEACRLVEGYEFPGSDRDMYIASACRALAFKAWRKDIEPFLRRKVEIVSVFSPCVWAGTDGLLESVPPEYPPAVVDTLRLLDEEIANMAKLHGLEVPAP